MVPGDGIGKEVIAEAVRVLEASGAPLALTHFDWGAERYLRKYLGQEPEGGAPKLAYAHWRLGTMYAKSGKKEQAIAEIETCLRAEPNFEPAKKDLKALK